MKGSKAAQSLKLAPGNDARLGLTWNVGAFRRGSVQFRDRGRRNEPEHSRNVFQLRLRVRFEGVTGLTVLHDRERLPNTNLTAFNKLHFSLLSILSFDRSLLCTFDEDRVCYYYLRSFSRSESLMFTFSLFMCLCFYSIS